MRRTRDERAEFLIVTLWDSYEAIRQFTGTDHIERAVYYPEDRGYLLAFEPEVAHYEVLVGPQPFGALLSLILDERGKMTTDAVELVEGRVAVLDVGMHTTDMILVEGLEYIEARSGSIEVGVSTAIDMMRKVLLDDHRVSYEPHELEVALRRGWLVIDGEKQRLNSLATDRLDPIARAIESQARTLWNISTLTAIVLAGGGALALKP